MMCVKRGTFKACHSAFLWKICEKLHKIACELTHWAHLMDHAMPHPSLCIWAHPHNLSLQLLY